VLRWCISSWWGLESLWMCWWVGMMSMGVVSGQSFARLLVVGCRVCWRLLWSPRKGTAGSEVPESVAVLKSEFPEVLSGVVSKELARLKPMAARRKPGWCFLVLLRLVASLRLCQSLLRRVLGSCWIWFHCPFNQLHCSGESEGEGLSFCVDFREVNAVSESDLSPIPNLKLLLESVSGDKFLQSLGRYHGLHFSYRYF
jgi:hypothetical protein